MAGAEPDLVHLDRLIAEPARLDLYDLVGFPAKAIPHVKVSKFTNSIKDHFLKSIDYIVVDIRGLTTTQKNDIKAYIAANHSGEGVYPSGRLLLLE